MQQNLFTLKLAEIKVTYQSKVKFKDMHQVLKSKDAEDVLRSIWNDTIELKEEFYILLLNRANRVKGWYKVSEGGTAGTIVDPKLIFSTALKCHASAIILAHNHPSGNTKPSEEDLKLTRKLTEGGKLLEIAVLDHLILTLEEYLSFADEGLM